MSIILGFIPKFLTRTQQMYFTQIGIKNSTQTVHPTLHINMETHSQSIAPPQQTQTRSLSAGQ